MIDESISLYTFQRLGTLSNGQQYSFIYVSYTKHAIIWHFVSLRHINSRVLWCDLRLDHASIDPCMYIEQDNNQLTLPI